MSKIKYPQNWVDAGSEGLIINFSELTSLCAANGLNSGDISYIAEQMRMSAIGTINRILESKAKS